MIISYKFYAYNCRIIGTIRVIIYAGRWMMEEKKYA